MSAPIINGVPAASSLPSGTPVSDASAAPAVNADAEQVGEPAVVESVAAAQGPLALEAVGLGKDFKLGRGQVLHAARNVSFGLYRGAVVARLVEAGWMG